jgi:hypothetical protein
MSFTARHVPFVALQNGGWIIIDNTDGLTVAVVPGGIDTFSEAVANRLAELLELFGLIDPYELAAGGAG